MGFVLLTLLPGCGYRFSVEGSGPTIGGGGARSATGPSLSLAIRTFINHTFQPNLEYKYTNYTRQEFTSGSGARVVFEETQADLLMKGEIVSVTIPSLTFSPNETRESRVNVVVRVTLEDRQSGRIVWKRSATGVGEFFVGSSSGTGGSTDTLQFNQVLQERALEQAGQDAAQQLADDFWAAQDQGTFSRLQESGLKVSPSGNSLLPDSQGQVKNPVTP